jgi:tRNA(Ile)-lysidine synthase
MLRGTRSDKDEKFVKQLSGTLGLEFYAAREDVAGRARQQRRNLEDVARTLRYEFFNAAVRVGRVTRVAVGHSSDDQAETVLAHLIRGTGPAGLGAIYPVAGAIVRPLLGVRRAELRDYLHKRKQTWREDRSNLDTTRMRARIRHKLLPLLENKFQRAVVSNLSRLSKLAREDEVFWKLLVDDCFEALVEKTGTTCSIAVHDLLLPLHFGSPASRESESANVRALPKRLIRRIMVQLKSAEPQSVEPASDRKQVTAGHIDQVMELAKKGTSGHAIHLPGGLVVGREFDRLIFSFRSAAGARETRARDCTPDHGKRYEYRVVLDAAGTASVPVAEIGSIFRLKVIDWPPLTSETRSLIAALDQALLRPPLLLRNWRPGDSYRPHGRKRTRKLKRLLLEKRVGLRDRAGWPVLTSAGALVWARGLPVAAEFAPRHETRASLVIAEEAL